MRRVTIPPPESETGSGSRRRESEPDPALPAPYCLVSSHYTVGLQIGERMEMLSALHPTLPTLTALHPERLSLDGVRGRE